MSILSDMYRVKMASGPGLFRQMFDLLPIAFKQYNVGLSDYYELGLYRFWKDQPGLRRDFLGWKYETAVSEVLNERQGSAWAWDKIAFHELLSHRGLPTIPVKAVYAPHRDCRIDARNLCSRDELVGFLSSSSAANTYIKAAHSQQGKDTLVVASIEPGGLRGIQGEFMSLESLLERIERPDDGYFRARCGWLFQEVLRPHDTIVQLSGSHSISGLRMVTLATDEGISLVKSVFKIAAAKSTVDNFQNGVGGNRLATVDVETGLASDPISSYWPGDNAQLISDAWEGGFQIPCWPEAVECVKAAARLFPLMKIQHWDVAITNQGPVLIEVNDLGASRLHQAHGSGMLTPLLRSEIRETMPHKTGRFRKLHRKWLQRAL